MPDLWCDVDAALSEVPVNILPLIDDTDFKTREESVVYNQAGMDLVWNFVTTAGAFTQTAVTPTTAGVHDWTSQGNGIYTLEIPASAGTINNDTEGVGWFTGFATGILPWRGPTIGFRAAGINNILIDSAYSANRGLAGTALPDAAADAAAGLAISDAGGVDLDTLAANVVSILPLANQISGSVNDGSPTVSTFMGDAGLSATNDLYNGQFLMFTGGALAGVARRISDYVGASKLLTFTDAWPTAPANTDPFYILPAHSEQTGDSYARLGAPAGASIAADVAANQTDLTTLLSRLSAARAGYLDNLNGHTAQTGDNFARIGAPVGASISADIAANQTDLTTLLTRLSAVRAGYLDNLNGHTAQTGDNYARLGAPVGASISADIAANQTDLTTLLTRLSAARAGYLDNLNGHTAQTGDSFARLGAPVGASISADVAGVPAAYEATVGEAEGSYTVAQIRRSMFSILIGRTSGGGTTFKTPDNAKTRATVTTDASNNRTAVTLTPDA